MAKSKKQKSGHGDPAPSAALPVAGEKKGKVVSADEAVRLVQNDATIATGGFVGIGFPEELAIALENR